MASSGVSGAGFTTIEQPAASARRELQHDREERHVPRHDRAPRRRPAPGGRAPSRPSRVASPRTGRCGSAGRRTRAPWWSRRPGRRARKLIGQPISIVTSDAMSPDRLLQRGEEAVEDVGALGRVWCATRGRPRRRARAAATARSTSAVARCGDAPDDLFRERANGPRSAPRTTASRVSHRCTACRARSCLPAPLGEVMVRQV